MTGARRLAWLAYAAAAWACGEGARAVPEPTYGPLGGEVARVGDTTLGAALVGEVARGRGVAPQVALGDLVEDALAAQGAQARGLDLSPAVRWASTDMLARGLSRRLWGEATAQGLPTDDETAQLTVVHAVVLRSPSLPEARARFTARAMAEAVATAKTSEEFQLRAKAASGDVRTTIEELPAFDVAGRMENGQQLDLDFTVAAFALHAEGDTSPIVETQFGWHVIRLISRARAPSDELERRRTELASAVLAARARSRVSQVLRERRDCTRIEVSEGAEEVMSQVAPER